MRLQNPFAGVSSTGLDSQVLTVLARTEQYLTVQQIHDLLPEEGSSQGVRKSVGRLVEQGTVVERITGRSFAYSLNRDHLLASSIQQIANAKSDLLSRLARCIEQWSVRPLTVKLFGSAARNEMHSGSDIDLLFVMPDSVSQDVADELINNLAIRAATWTGNDVRPLVYKCSEVDSAGIFDSILKEGVDVAGDPTWLRKTLRGQKARS